MVNTCRYVVQSYCMYYSKGLYGMYRPEQFWILIFYLVWILLSVYTGLRLQTRLELLCFRYFLKNVILQYTQYLNAFFFCCTLFPWNKSSIRALSFILALQKSMSMYIYIYIRYVYIYIRAKGYLMHGCITVREADTEPFRFP